MSQSLDGYAVLITGGGTGLGLSRRAPLNAWLGNRASYGHTGASVR